jgi:hypothetical protein
MTQAALVPYGSWDQVRKELTQSPYHRTIVIPKDAIADPASAGALRSIGIPRGQSGDYRFPPDASCQGVHVQDYGDSWHVHLDLVHPACGVLAHVRADAPRLGAYAALAGIGGLAGGVFGRGKRDVIVGLSAGILTALLVDFTASCVSTKEPIKDETQ